MSSSVLHYLAIRETTSARHFVEALKLDKTNPDKPVLLDLAHILPVHADLWLFPTSSQQPTSSTPTITPNEKAVRTGGDGQLSEDEPDGHRDRREYGTKRTRVEEKSDDGMSSVTATANKIDDDRLSQEPQKLEEAKAIRKAKFASVIDQCDEGDPSAWPGTD